MQYRWSCTEKKNKIKPRALSRQQDKNLSSALPHKHLPFWLFNFLILCFFHWTSLTTPPHTPYPRLWKRQEMNLSSLGGSPVIVWNQEPTVMQIKTQVQIPNMFLVVGRRGRKSHPQISSSPWMVEMINHSDTKEHKRRFVKRASSRGDMLVCLMMYF